MVREKAFLAKKRTSRCFAALLLALCVTALLFSAPVPRAYAQEEADTRAFTQEIVSDTPVFRTGEQARISLSLTCTTFETYPMYAYASTLRIDTDMLRIDQIIPRKDVDVTTVAGINTDEPGTWTNIVINYRSRSLAGNTWQQNETVVTLVVTPLAAGQTAATTSRVNVSNSTGMSRMPCTCTDLPVLVDDPLPLEVQSAAYTPASGLSLVSFAGSSPDGTVPCYKGRPFVWDGARFVALIAAQEVSRALNADFSFAESEADQLVRGDVNDNGRINVVDAQLAYDVARGRFVDFSQLPLKGWLSCDINKDGLVDAADALAIQAESLLHWPE